MLTDWLVSLGKELPADGESCVLRFDKAPELWLEKIMGDYVLAVSLAPLPAQMLSGVLLMLLQVNSPLSVLRPARLTADGRGHLLLWLTLDERAEQYECQAACDLLHGAHQTLLLMLQEQEETPATRTSGMFV